VRSTGHTNGGRVQLPFVRPPIIPSRYGQRLAVGHDSCRPGGL